MKVMCGHAFSSNISGSLKTGYYGIVNESAKKGVAVTFFLSIKTTSAKHKNHIVIMGCKDIDLSDNLVCSLLKVKSVPALRYPYHSGHDQRNCKLEAGQRGFCFVRTRKNEKIISTTYGFSQRFLY